MSIKIIHAPGENLEEFLSRIANDLKTRRVEYVIAGFFNSSGQPMGMIEEKGRSSWVEFSLNEIIETAKKLKATGILLLHNHPRKMSEKPALEPSQADIQSLKAFINLLDNAGLEYYGDWIVSNGHVSEILNHLNNRKIDKESSNISDIEMNRMLNMTVKNAVNKLTKTALLQVYWYKMSEEKFVYHKLIFHVLKLRYWGDETEVYQFKITDADQMQNPTQESTGFMSVEEANKAYDAINELLNISKQLQSKNIEYTEVKIVISSDIICGFYQTGTEQNGFLYIGNGNLFLPVNKLNCIVDFIRKGFEKIDEVLNSNDES